MPQEAQKTYFLDFLAVLPAAFFGEAFLVFVAFLVAITITPGNRASNRAAKFPERPSGNFAEIAGN